MHSNLKEKRQILRDTVNHIQTIHKEKGDRRKKNRKGLLTKYLTFYIWENTDYAILDTCISYVYTNVKKTYSRVEQQF